MCCACGGGTGIISGVLYDISYMRGIKNGLINDLIKIFSSHETCYSFSMPLQIHVNEW